MMVLAGLGPVAFYLLYICIPNYGILELGGWVEVEAAPAPTTTLVTTLTVGTNVTKLSWRDTMFTVLTSHRKTALRVASLF